MTKLSQFLELLKLSELLELSELLNTSNFDLDSNLIKTKKTFNSGFYL